MEAELQRALLTRGTLYKSVESGLLGRLLENAERYGMSSRQAAAAFDKFMTTQRLGSESVSAEDVQAFMGSEHARGGTTRPQPLAAARSNNLFNRVSLEDVVMADLGESVENEGRAAGMQQQQQQAPTNQRMTPYLSKVASQRPGSAAKVHTPTTGGKFAERHNAGAVVTSLNANLAAAPANANDGDVLGEEGMEVDGAAQQGAAAGRHQMQQQRCVVEVLGRPMGASDKFMVDRLEDKVAFLEGRLVAAEEVACAAMGCDVHPVATACQQSALFVGRVCCDSEGGRLNAHSLLLEGSQRSSAGARVRLDVAHLPSYRLFPGQVLALRGTNPSGHCVVAQHLLPGLATPPAATPMGQLAAFAGATGSRGQSIVVAAGPFTSTEDLEYAPLGALLDYCALPAHRPDVLLLLGPFVDAEHPAVKGGLMEESFEEVYASRVLGQISRFTSAVGGHTRVLLVPSTRDVLSMPVLPQPPLPCAGLPGGSSSLPLANPATLRLNEVVLGCTSADWLMACNREETAKAAAGEERLPALAAHLAAQRCYFPMFPPPLDSPVDCAWAGTALAMPASPDLLILPSDLAPFAKLCPLPQPGEAAACGEAGAEGDAEAAPQQPAAVPATVAHTVCVNPGRLTKGASGGTFAHIHIHPLPEALAVAGGAPAATNAAVPHQVDQRCRVDIRRI